MESYEYEDLLPSFTLDEPPFCQSSTIDTLCQTYLGDLQAYDPTLPTSSSSSSYLSSSPFFSSSSSLSSSPFTHDTSSYPLLEGGEAYNGSLLEEMEAYTRMDVRDWRGEDTLDWAGSVCRRRGLDQSTLDLWAFRNTPGAHLLTLGVGEFSDLVGDVYGPVFHAELQDYCRKREEGQRWRQKTGGSSPYSDSGSQFDLGGDLGDLDLTSEEIRDLDRYIQDPLVGGLQEMDLEGAMPLCYDTVDSCPEPVAQLSLSPASPVPHPTSPSSSSAVPSPNHLALPDPLKKIKLDPKKRPRGPKNWEFVIRLLADPRTNPSLIRWEQKEEGTFRLVQPAAIASMWGQRSDRPNLSYDNFARGLRYHYTTGALQPVSEKQLVYRCGPKAVKYLIELSKGNARH